MIAAHRIVGNKLSILVLHGLVVLLYLLTHLADFRTRHPLTW
jgi:hypothetical protein